jgi:hypothetical protein
VQLRFHESKAKYSLMEGGPGGGKSTALLWEASANACSAMQQISMAGGDTA